MNATDLPQKKAEMEGQTENLRWLVGPYPTSEDPDMSYYKSKITQQFHNDPDNYNTLLFWLPGEDLKAVFTASF